MVDVEIPRVALTLEQDRNALATAALRGDVVRVRRGAYCAPGDLRADGATRHLLEERNRALARVGALHSQLRAEHVFGHASAALLLGCRVWSIPRETHVYQHYRASGHACDDVRRHSWTLAPDDVADAAGLPVTTLERTVVDCARTMHPLEGLVIADSALALGAERGALLDVLAAGAGTAGRAGQGS